MRRRFVVWGLTGSVAVAVLGACAAISGLQDFSSGGCTGCFEGGQGSDSVASDDVAQATDSQGDAVEWADTGDDATQDGPPVPMEYTDAAADVWADARDGAPPFDATGASDGEAGGARDATADAAAPDAPPDAAPDAGPDAAPDAPSCNNASCDGCCTASGLCAAGGVTSACGMGGAACQNCSTSGLVCSGRACVSMPVDAGNDAPTGCNPTTCTNLCVPYFIQCCKADQSCGCAVFFPRGTCN